MQLVPYLVGGLTAFLVMDIVPVPSATEQFGFVRAAISAPSPVLGTLDSSINRSAKGDRLQVSVTREQSSSAVKSAPIKDIREPARDADHARDRKPPSSKGPKVPVGCEPSFSPVAAPSLAHHTGRCMAHLETPLIAG